MKQYALIIFIAIILSSCGENADSNNSKSDMDSVNVNVDSVHTGNSSSSSEFNKGNSSPTGSTGSVDSTIETKLGVDKTANDLDSTKIRKNTKDSIK